MKKYCSMAEPGGGTCGKPIRRGKFCAECRPTLNLNKPDVEELTRLIKGLAVSARGGIASKTKLVCRDCVATWGDDMIHREGCDVDKALKIVSAIYPELGAEDTKLLDFINRRGLHIIRQVTRNGKYLPVDKPDILVRFMEYGDGPFHMVDKRFRSLRDAIRFAMKKQDAINYARRKR